VDTYLPLNAEESQEFTRGLEETGLAEREEIMEIVTSWMREGMQKGLVQGRQEGAAEVVLRFIRRSLGALSEEREGRVRRLPVEKIEALGDALPDLHSMDDLDAWLARNG
jgi:hypothetical protein